MTTTTTPMTTMRCDVCGVTFYAEDLGDNRRGVIMVACEAASCSAELHRRFAARRRRRL